MARSLAQLLPTAHSCAGLPDSLENSRSNVFASFSIQLSQMLYRPCMSIHSLRCLLKRSEEVSFWVYVCIQCGLEMSHFIFKASWRLCDFPSVFFAVVKSADTGGLRPYDVDRPPVSETQQKQTKLSGPLHLELWGRGGGDVRRQNINNR